MTMSDDLFARSIVRLSRVPGVLMNPGHLVNDVALLEYAFPDEYEFLAAVLATERAMLHVEGGSVTSSGLRGSYSDWNSYHYQHRVGQGRPADMRLLWQRRDSGLYVLGFGHRWIPRDIYERLRDLR